MKERLMKILIIELIIVSLLFMFLLDVEFKFIDSINETIEALLTKEEPLPIIDNFTKDTDDKIDLYIDNKQNEKATIYELIRDGLLEGKEAIPINEKLLGKDRENFFDTVEEVLLDNPEIMYYTSGKYSYNTFYPNYSMSMEKKLLHQKSVKDKRDEIIYEIIKENMSQYEKVKTIHDYIINNTKYDSRHFSGEIIPDESYTVYGVLFEGIAVCEGYAKTMKYLLDAAGIDTLLVIGEANGENHAWNMVNIEGHYYHIDATWNDPVTEDGTDILIYDYFNLKDEDIGKTHTWNRDKYPVCNSDKYNYHYYNGLVANDYNEFYSKINYAMKNGKGEVSLKVPYYDEKNYNIPSTIRQIAENNIGIININRYAYSFNSNQNIIRIYFYK